MDEKVYTVVDLYKDNNTIDVFTKVFFKQEDAFKYVEKVKNEWLKLNDWWNILSDIPWDFEAETNDYEYTQTLYVQESDFIY